MRDLRGTISEETTPLGSALEHGLSDNEHLAEDGVRADQPLTEPSDPVDS